MSEDTCQGCPANLLTGRVCGAGGRCFRVSKLGLIRRGEARTIPLDMAEAAGILWPGEKTYVGQDIRSEPGHRILGGSSGRWQLGDPCPSSLPAVLFGVHHIPPSRLEPVRWMVPLSSLCIPGESANLGFPPLDAYGRCGAGAWSGSGGNLGKIYIFLPFAGYRRVDVGAPGSLVPCHSCGRVT